MTCEVAQQPVVNLSRGAFRRRTMIADLRVNGADVFRCSCVLKQDSDSNADPTCPAAPVSLLGCVDASPITGVCSDPGLSGGDMWLQFTAASRAS